MIRKDLAIERYQLAHEQALFSLLSKEGCARMMIDLHDIKKHLTNQSLMF
ncbi:hypothetical protein IGI46_003955 [Enterococcus sp. AZ163]